MDYSNKMVIFNNQCYDVTEFDIHRKREYRNRSLNGGRLKDPCTGENYPYQTAISTLLFPCSIGINFICEMITNRTPLTFGEAMDYVPETDNGCHCQFFCGIFEK